MLKHFAAAAALCAAVSTANARDFGLERFASIVNTIYPGYSVFAPFVEAPSGADPLHLQMGYVGSVWNMGADRGRGGSGSTYSHGDFNYCNPIQAVMPPARNTARVQNWRYRTEITLTGDFTVTGATPNDTIFKLTAIDAKYINSVTVDIKNTVRYSVPYDVLKNWSSEALARCPTLGANRVLTSAIAGDVTVKIYFVAGVSATLQFDIASKVKANLGFNVTPVQIGTDTAPAMVLTEGNQIFAIAAQPAPLR
ncbi:MAG: hypothetical protein AB1490_19045 [Pseudomonadota bacterium]